MVKEKSEPGSESVAPSDPTRAETL